MTIAIDEAWYEESIEVGTSVNDDSAEVPYILRTDDEETRQDILDWIIDPVNVIHEFLGMRIRTITLNRMQMEDRWSCVVQYESGSSSWTLPRLEVDDVRWEITGSSGATARRTYSDSLVSETLPSGSTAPALDTTAAETVMGLVYRDGDLEVEGTDVPTGGSTVVIQTVKDHATMVTGGHAITLLDYQDVHVVNSDIWKIFPAGTLRLETAAIRPRAGDDPDWDVTLTCAYSKNLTNINVGNGITGISKSGHQLLDVLFAKKQVAGLPLSVPIRAAVHDINPTANFTTELLL